MSRQRQKYCVFCNQPFAGRRDAKTCSPRCRKRLQLMRAGLVGIEEFGAAAAESRAKVAAAAAAKAPSLSQPARRSPKRRSGGLLALLILGLAGTLSLLFSYSPPKATALTGNNDLNFQARLLNAAGAVVPDGNYNIDFKIYNADGVTGTVGACSGSCLWEETWTNAGGHGIPVVNGYFSVQLGSVTSFPLTINWDDNLYLTMNIGGTSTGSVTWDGEMQNGGHSIPINAVPYAFRAGVLSQLVTSQEQTLRFASSYGQATTITLPDPGASTANVCYQNSAACGFAPGSSGSYIQNGTGLQSNASFAIQSSSTSNVVGLLRAHIGQTANIFEVQTNSPIDNAFTIAADGSVHSQASDNNAAAFQVQNSSGASVLNVDTSNLNVSVPDLSAAGTISLQGPDGGSILLRTAADSGSDASAMTFSGNEITDVTRATGLQGDGRQPPDSSTGIWESTTNLAPNGGFENNTTGWLGYQGGTIVRDTSTAKFGTASLKVTTPGSVNNEGVAQNTPYSAVSASSPYTISAWVKGSGTVVLLAKEYTDTSGVTFTQNGANSGTVTLNGTWQRVTATVTSGSSTGAVRVFVYTQSTIQAITFWVDGVQIEQKGYATPYVDTNGSTATRNQARVQAPTSLVSGSANLWFAARVRVGALDGTTSQSIEGYSNGSFTNYDMLYIKSNGVASFQTNDSTNGLQTASQGSALTAGSVHTIVGYATSSSVAVSLDGGNFTITNHANAPSGMNAFDIGGLDGNAGNVFDGDILWSAAGTGTLSNADAASLYALGNSDPSISGINSMDSAASPTFAWDGESNTYSGTNNTPTDHSGISIDDVNLYHSANGSLALQGGVNSTTAFQVQSTTGSDVLGVDTTTYNLVPNSDFEVNSSGWSPVGTGVTAARSTNYSYSGSASLQINTNGNVYDGAAYPLTLSPGQYTLSVYVGYTSNTFSNFEFGYSTDGVSQTFVSTNNVVKSGSFLRYSLTFTVVSTSGTPALFFEQGGAGTRTFYIDAIQVESGNTATPYRVGGLNLGGVVTSPVAFKNTSDSNTAFQIQDSSGYNLLTVDTQQDRIGIGKAPSQAALDVSGNVNASTGLMTNGTSRIDSSGNLTNIGNFTSTAGTTFQTTGANGFVFKPGTDNAAAFQVQGATTGSLLNIDSINSIITLDGNDSGQLASWSTNSYAIGCTTPGCGSPVGLYGHSSVTANGYLYIIGGESSGSAVSTVYYAKLNSDGSTGAWQTDANSLPVALYNHSSVTASGYVYVLGGYTGSAGVNTVYYAKLNSDGSTGAWQSNPSLLPENQYMHSSVVANGYVYVIGGATGSGKIYYAKLNSDGSTGAWQTNAINETTSTQQQSALVANGYLYVIAGYTGSYIAHVYYAKLNANGSTGSFTTNANDLPQGLREPSAVVSNGYMYVLGGYTGTSYVSTVYYGKLSASDGSIGLFATNTSNPLPTGSYGQTSVVSNGYVYDIGGYDSPTYLSSIYYSSIARLQVGANLDLVGLQGSDLSDGGDQSLGSSGGSLTAGNITGLGNLQIQGGTSIGQSLAVDGNISVGGQLYVSSSLPTSQFASLTIGGSPNNITMQNGYAFINYGSGSTYQIVDVNNPASPAAVSTVTTPASPAKTVVQGHYAYTITSGTSFQVDDISNPKSPTTVGTATIDTHGNDLVVSGRYAYVATLSSSNGLAIIDISNPAHPVQVGDVTGLQSEYSVYVQGNYAYLVGASAKLNIINISNPANPVVTNGAGAPMGSQGHAVVVRGSYAYSIDRGNNTLYVFNISDPTTTAAAVGSITTNLSTPEWIKIQGNYAYVTNNGNNTVSVYDISSPASPVAVGTIPTSGAPWDLYVQGRYMYVTTQTSGLLQVFDLGGEYAQQLQAGGTETGTLQVDSTAKVAGDLSVQGAATIGQSLNVNGNLTVSGSGGIALATDTTDLAVNVNNLQASGTISLQGQDGGSIVLRTEANSGTGGNALTFSGNEITDAVRAADVSGDGRPSPDSSTGIWGPTDNFATNGGFENNATGWTTGANNTIAQDSTHAKFGTHSLKATYNNSGTPGTLADYSFTASSSQAYTYSGWVYIPSSYTGTQVQLKASNFASAAGTLSTNANMSLRNQWQRIYANFTPAAGDLTGDFIFGDTGTPTAGNYIYIDGFMLDDSSFTYPKPYVDTNGSTSTRNAGRIQAPSSLLSASQGWAAFRIRYGEVGGTGLNDGAFLLGNAATNIVYLYFDGSNWSLVSNNGGSSDIDTLSGGSPAAGATATVAAYWTSSNLYISVNGSAFQPNARAQGVPTVGANLDIGSMEAWFAGSALNGDIFWSAMGTGTLTNTDAAFLYSLGNSDPSVSGLSNMDGASAPDFAWDGEGGAYSSTTATPTPSSSLSIDDVSLTHTGNGSLALQGATNSTTAFQVQNTGGLAELTVNTSGNIIQIGSATGNTNGIVVGLNNYNATVGTEPTEQDGAMYYNSTIGEFRCGVAGAWESCGGLSIANTSTTTCTNTTTATSCTPNNYFTSAAPSIPANYCLSGRVIHVYASGIYSGQTSASKLTFSVRLAGTIIGAAGSATTGTVSNMQWHVDFYITCDSTTTVTGEGTVYVWATAAGSANTGQMTGTGTTTVTNTGAQAITLYVNVGATADFTSITLEQFIVQGM